MAADAHGRGSGLAFNERTGAVMIENYDLVEVFIAAGLASLATTPSRWPAMAAPCSIERCRGTTANCGSC